MKNGVLKRIFSSVVSVIFAFNITVVWSSTSTHASATAGTPAPDASQLGVINIYNIPGQVVVSSLSVGDTATVYSAATGSTLVGSSQEVSGTAVVVLANQLANAGGTLYVSVTRGGVESARTAVTYPSIVYPWSIYDHTGNWGEDNKHSNFTTGQTNTRYTSTALTSHTPASYPAYPNSDDSTDGNTSHNKHIIIKDNGSRVTFYGYGVPNYKDFLYLPSDSTSLKTVTFNFNLSTVSYHTLEGAGFLFNIQVVSGKLNGYAVLFTGAVNSSNVEDKTKRAIKLYKLTNVDPTALNNATTDALTTISGITQLAPTVYATGTAIGDSHHITLQITQTSFTMIDSDNGNPANGYKMIDSFALPTTYGSGLGFIASYLSHQCSVLSYLTFNNVTISDSTWPIMDLTANTATAPGQVVLTYTAPVDASAVIVQQSTDGVNYTTSRTLVPVTINSSSVTVTGLTNNTGYSFRVLVGGGINAGGSNVASATPTGAYMVVTFNSNGGETYANPPSISMAANSTVGALPTSPTRSGYTFTGWNTQVNGGGTAVTAATAVGANMTVYAQWARNTVIITYDNDNGDTPANPASQTIFQGTASGALPVEPTKAHYVFSGWYTAQNGGGTAFDSATTVQSTLTVYAKWTPVSTTVSLDPNGGAGGSAIITAAYGLSMPVATGPTRAGYVFLGYFDDPNNGTQYYTSAMGSAITWDKDVATTTLYAQWEATHYTVTFSANGGLYSDTTDVTGIEEYYGSTYRLPTELPTLADNTFSAWNTARNGSGTTVTDATVVSLTAPQTLYAIWTDLSSATLSYAVGGDADDGTLSLYNETINATSGTAVGATATAGIGYHFAKWIDSGGNTVSMTETYIPTQVSGSYQTATYTAIFDPNENTPYLVEHYVMDTSGNYPAIATATDSFTGQTDEFLTLSALKTDGLQVPGGITYNHGTAGGTQLTTTDISDDGSLIIKLYYDRSQYTLSLGSGVGTSNATGAGTYYYGQAVTLSVDVSPGHTWSKWLSSVPDLLADQTDRTAVFTMPAGALTLSAQTLTDLITSAVTLDDSGGNGGSGHVTATVGLDMPPATAPTRPTYSFAGYYDDLASGTLYYNHDMTSARVWNKTDTVATLFAHWSTYAVYTVAGNVVDDSPTPVPVVGAQVVLLRSNTQFGTTATTGAGGTFTINNVPAGDYNLVITLDDHIVTLKITVSAASTSFPGIVLPLGNASSQLSVSGSNTPTILVDNLQPEAENQYSNSGSAGFMKVVMTVEKTDKTTAENAGNVDTATAIDAISTQASGMNATIALYLDITLDQFSKALVTDTWGSGTKIPQTANLVQIIIQLPNELQGMSSYAIYRYHGASVTQITSAPNADGEYLILDTTNWTLTLFAKNFSVYAIAFTPVSSQTGNSAKQYPVIKSAPAYGDISLSATNAYSGQTVSLLPTPLPGYTLALLTIQDASGAAIPYTALSDGTCTFLMPASSVTITATFKRLKLDPTVTGVSKLLQAEDHIHFLNGYPDGSVRPENNMKRCEAVQMFYNLLLTKQQAALQFTDVTADDWFAPAVSALDALGIVSGYPDGSFGPQDDITREQFVVMALRFASYQPKTFTYSFPDVTDQDWSFKSILTAATLGWVSGDSSGAFNPKSFITRAEIATIVDNMLNREADRTWVNSHTNELRSFTDLQDNTKWYYLTMREATNNHDHGRADTGDEIWQNLK